MVSTMYADTVEQPMDRAKKGHYIQAKPENI